MIEIYTDGAYNPALDQGGWGAVIVQDEQKHALSGIVKKTTSNRMEITAALEGISRTPPGSEVAVYTDSQYLFGSMTKDWQRRANRDLWQELDAAVGKRKTHWRWIDRNSDNVLHKEAHTLANTLASQSEMPLPPEESEGEVKDTVAGGLTHIDESGRPRMVDISEKPDTERQAVAKCLVRMKPSTLALLKEGNMPKGDVLAVAQLAGIMAAKQTPHLIPLCHPVLTNDIYIEFSIDEEDSAVEITSTVKSVGKTGVEMEALTATAVAALNIYDMCKAVDRGVRVESMRLVRKSGGKSGTINLEQS